MKALVTGGGGFLGRYIVEQLLSRGDHVRTYSRGAHPDLRALGVDTWQGDLRDGPATDAACAGVEVVFHVAGVAGVWGAWSDYFGVNTLGTYHIVAGCSRHGVRGLVFTSSPSVTFDGRDQEHVNESTPYARRYLYD